MIDIPSDYYYYTLCSKALPELLVILFTKRLLRLIPILSKIAYVAPSSRLQLKQISSECY